ncbi:hypothetical protein O9929_11450 [Vibrio lentus]|nr:hypothetical protein [Vibrio lentus]
MHSLSRCFFLGKPRSALAMLLIQVDEWAPKKAFFLALTNVNFDPAPCYQFAQQSHEFKQRLEQKFVQQQH